MTNKSIGHFERCQGQRYWAGGCTCGSGREGHELYDGRGIYAGITCSSCKREDKYRPEIMNRGYDEHDVDEPIEPEDY